MSDYLVQRIDAASRITLHTETEVVALHGERHLEGLTWRNNNTGATEDRAVSHLFLMIGASPNTQWLNDCLKLDDSGFVLTGEEATRCGDWPLQRPAKMLETSVPGVFATGDVRSGSIKRVASAVGEGAMTVTQLHQVLAELGSDRHFQQTS